MTAKPQFGSCVTIIMVLLMITAVMVVISL